MQWADHPLHLCGPSPKPADSFGNLVVMFFRHPDQVDRPRTRSDYAEGAELGIRGFGQGLMALLCVLAFVSVLALVSLAANGASLVPLLVMFAAFAVLAGLSGLRSD